MPVKPQRKQREGTQNSKTRGKEETKSKKAALHLLVQGTTCAVRSGLNIPI